MTRSYWFKLVGTVVLLGVGGWAAADQRTEDWKQAAELFSTYYRDLNTKYSFAGHEAEYLESWTQWSEALQAFLPAFKQKYGDTVADVEAKFEDAEAPQGVGNSIRQICQDFYDFDLAAKQKEIAGWAAEAGNEAYTKWQNYTPPDAAKIELKLDLAERALAHYRRSAQIDPDGDGPALVKKAEQAVAESGKVWKESLKELKWPGHNSEFAGPGDPKDLAKEALKLLQSVESWSKPEYDDEHIPVAVCVTGKGWEVSKKNPITQVPTQYSLDFVAAFAGTVDADLAYVYHMVFYTAEEEGVEKKPPFRYVNSRQYAKYRMLMANVPRMAKVKVPAKSGGKAADDTPTCGACPALGCCGLLFRILLGLILLLAGFLCAQEFISGKVAALGAVGGKLAPVKETLGLVAAALAVAAFLRVTLLFLNPIADILPQALALVSGLLLVAPEKLPGPLQKVQALGGRSRDIGLAAIAFGVLHLLLGGWWLV